MLGRGGESFPVQAFGVPAWRLYGIAVELFGQDKAQHAPGIAQGVNAQDAQIRIFIPCGLHHQTVRKTAIEHFLEFARRRNVAKMLGKAEKYAECGGENNCCMHLFPQFFQGYRSINEPLWRKPLFMQQAYEEKGDYGKRALDTMNMPVEALQEKV